MENPKNSIEDLSPEDLSRFVMDMLHRIIVHHTLWFREVEHQFGFDKALEIMKSAYRGSYAVQMKRLSQFFDFKMIDGIPKPLVDMPRERLLKLISCLGTNWIAGDGVWFQAVESTHGMNDAKRCNDTCWTRFSPFEAWSIKEFLGLPEHPGIEGLKQALKFRMYASVNTQTIIDEGPDCIVFEMNDCRVQSARKRRGLDDYPCKSVGLVEYGRFAQTIDPGIKTECIGCPPDPHPKEWFCSWRFIMNRDK
ncbi:MAG TPA: DUF6125 family protein [Desulfobacteraceae bacterium]|nr:DUF6125 family protein [Desulfobacteraceae bacterium]HPQ28254.1 DUF6125 family protein [Desulfobacteraceae bacterium]